MIKTYWVVFTNTDKWWGCLLKKNFSHVCIVFQDEYGFWTTFNPADQHLEISLVPFTEKDQNTKNYPKLLRNSGYHVVKIEKIEKINGFSKIKWYNIKIGLFFNCVTLCRYFMGIGASRITPYGFYKQLCYLGRYENWKQRYNNGISSVQVLI